jgi:ribonuclease T1
VFSCGLAERGAELRQALGKWGLAVAIVSGLLAGTAVQGRGSEPPPLAMASLPGPAQQTYRLVLSGGPFPYPQDGGVFGNRERLLPGKERGFYREYTVQTPGASDRGARRIICGGQRPSEPEACYYTADHYASFHRIVQ